MSNALFKGSFAKVKLCREKSSREVLALKIMSICEILRMKQVEHVKSEKTILQVVMNIYIKNQKRDINKVVVSRV